MANVGQQSRLSFKLKRNLEQVLLASEGISAQILDNGFDKLVKITDAAGNSNFLVKFKEQDVTGFAVPGFPVHKICVCVDTAADMGIVVEVIARIKELGCGIEVHTAADPFVVDVATAAGVFTGTTYKRFVRAAVDSLNLGQ